MHCTGDAQLQHATHACSAHLAHVIAAQTIVADLLLPAVVPVQVRPAGSSKEILLLYADVACMASKHEYHLPSPAATWQHETHLVHCDRALAHCFQNAFARENCRAQPTPLRTRNDDNCNCGKAKHERCCKAIRKRQIVTNSIQVPSPASPLGTCLTLSLFHMVPAGVGEPSHIFRIMA